MITNLFISAQRFVNMNKKGASQVTWVVMIGLITLLTALLLLWMLKYGGWDTMKSIVGFIDPYKNTTAATAQAIA